MLQLPKIKKDPKETAQLCKCRPICKSRRRKWKGQTQNSSAELVLERQPQPECFRRWPTRVYPNSPCPLFAKSRRVTVKERDHIPEARVVRICEAVLDDTVDTTYLEYAELAKQLGAWDAVRACCAFCGCGACCPCAGRRGAWRGAREEEEGTDDSRARRHDMRRFDERVRRDWPAMRIMYDTP
ncbi:uncharacterized protein LOC126969651 [Leptidea sinapis]|uniref:uncharacterized protein LOC126969651 n=1 Tax=Leptidea sinapis TaxID=189913 RepID=UPI00212986CB|nr:uncharacterized protein LOC126969651 [Leptidea sinapis]